jgi:hypothetical protein
MSSGTHRLTLPIQCAVLRLGEIAMTQNPETYLPYPPHPTYPTYPPYLPYAH